MSNLILTGFGWSEYAVAAAVALKGLDGKSDVAGVSKRRLPEYLEALPGDWKRIYIVGVSLGGDEERLANALKRLKAKGVQVSWISAYAPSESQQTNVLPHLKAQISETDTLLEAVGKFFSVDVKPFAPFADEGKKVPNAVRDYRELLEAAQFAYRNYQDEVLYATAIRYLATGIRPEAWSDEVRQAIAHYRRYGGRELVGKSPQMRTLQERINRVAQFPDARVLILGESGTGKETVAQQIHNKSPRKREPFYAFNCASVNPDLLESRFFGHEKGAYTGADKQELGLFELANGGTLFLDEIGELPLEAQGLLLRVLEGGRFMRLGGKDEIAVDVRLITATNRNLPVRVREGRFREDLFQRLNVVQLRIPALREHKDDIRDIADGWWINRHHKHLSQENLAALMEYDYPGNVRELLNLLDRATVLGEDDFASMLNEHREMNAGLTDGACSESGLVPDELEAVKAKKQGQVEQQEQRLKELAPAVRNMEQLAAQFSDDPERILPEPGPLESAKSYREKKAKPLLAKIVKVLRSLYRAYVELKGKYERLQGDYGRAKEGNERLSDRLMEVKMENKKLRQISANYTRVKRVFGPEQVEAAVEADKQREQAEKDRKRPRRSLDRDGR